MKYIYKILAILFVSVAVVSCDRDQGDTDYLNNRENSIYFSNGQSATVFVEDGAANVFDIPIGVAAIANSNIPYTLSIDPESTAVEGEDFTIVSSTQVSQGEILTAFQVQASLIMHPKKEKLLHLFLNLQKVQRLECKINFL